MADHENHETPKTPAPAPSKAFPANVEPKGRTHFGPPPRPPRPSEKNILNTDPHGRRRPGEK